MSVGVGLGVAEWVAVCVCARRVHGLAARGDQQRDDDANQHDHEQCDERDERPGPRVAALGRRRGRRGVRSWSAGSWSPWSGFRSSRRPPR